MRQYGYAVVGRKNRVERRCYSEGEVIFKAGDSSNSAFLIIDGTVRILLNGDAERAEMLGSVSRGEYFGEMGLSTTSPDRPLPWRTATLYASR